MHVPGTAVSRPPCYLATSRGLQQHVHLPALLGGELSTREQPSLTAVLAWGRKPSAVRAEQAARRLGLPLLRLEDGFLRSVAPGRGDPGLSLVVDDCGIYYDAAAPSRLEQLVLAAGTPQALARGAALQQAWCEQRVSKYNQAPELTLAGAYVLVIDQTAGDASIAGGLASADSFQHMLQAALDEYPQARIVVKLHPEVVAGHKRGHFSRELARNPRILLLADDVHPAGLLQQAQAVYVVTSQIGFEALLWGRPVHCFGMPFYAGWGLTRDALPPPARRQPVALAQLVHAALVDYARYVDPETGQRCAPEQLIAWLGLQRRERQRWSGPLYASGFSRWKRPLLQAFLQGAALQFVASTEAVPAGATQVVWGRRPVPPDCPVLRVEDGFLRSVGLGAELWRPLSWVVDDLGLYYDATQPSRLEHILQHEPPAPAAVQRAARLRQAIVAAGITKYNVGRQQWRRPPHRAGPVILVPGQVEADMSIRYGAARIRTNEQLLRAVRQLQPQAHIVYKPHPDVQAGLRRHGSPEQVLRGLCDEVVYDVPMHELLAQVDEVHVLTSLAGFEALLRGVPVSCHGMPFYAGWGLTHDLDLLPEVAARRQRRLHLDELVHGALIAYPRYVSRTTGRFTTPERALDELVQWRARPPALPLWRRLWMRLWCRIRG